MNRTKVSFLLIDQFRLPDSLLLLWLVRSNWGIPNVFDQVFEEIKGFFGQNGILPEVRDIGPCHERAYEKNMHRMGTHRCHGSTFFAP